MTILSPLLTSTPVPSLMSSIFSSFVGFILVAGSGLPAGKNASVMLKINREAIASAIIPTTKTTTACFGI